MQTTDATALKFFHVKVSNKICVKIVYRDKLLKILHFTNHSSSEAIS